MGVGWSEGLPMTESAALPMLCSCATAVTETKQVYMRTVMIFLFFCLWKGVYRRTVRIISTVRDEYSVRAILASMGDLALQWYWRGAADKDGVAKEVLAMPPGGFLIRSSTSTLDAYVLTVNDHGIILVRNSILSRKKKALFKTNYADYCTCARLHEFTHTRFTR